MSSCIIPELLFFLVFLTSHSHAFTFQSPTTPIAFGLYFNLTWTSGKGDPRVVAITSSNLNTTKSFTLTNNTDTKKGNVVVRIMPDTPASHSGIYTLQAVDVSNSTRVLDMISPFNVSTTPISLSPVLTTSENTKSSSSLGALLGGVVGGLVFVALLVAAGFIYHRRRRNRHVAVRLPDYDEHLVSNMQQEWEAQVYDAMAEAQRRSKKMGSNSNSRRAHSRLESTTHTASVTSEGKNTIYSNYLGVP